MFIYKILEKTGFFFFLTGIFSDIRCVWGRLPLRTIRNNIFIFKHKPFWFSVQRMKTDTEASEGLGELWFVWGE